MSTPIPQTALFRVARPRAAKTKDGSDLLSVKGTMQRRDGDAIVSRGFVSGLVSEEETMQDGCIVEDDDWVFWGVATYRHDDSNAVRSLLMATVR
jgi:hypothetical protein